MKDLDKTYSVEFQPEEADIKVGGASYFLMRREAYCLLYKEMASIIGRGAEAILFRAGYERAKEFYATSPTSLGSQDPDDIVEAAKFLSSRLGLYRVLSFTLNPSSRTAELVVDRSFEVCEGHPSTGSRCHYTRGFWAGLVEEMLGGDISIIGKEPECQGTGDEHCRFEFSVLPI
ncbi:MAG: V4R domain-containing protein [Thermoplasmata archaeon]